MRLSLPQPYEEVPHTADAAVRARGASAEEALARLGLAFAQLSAGGGPLEPAREEVLEIAGGPDLAATMVAAMRELLFRFASRRELPAWIEVESLAPERARLRCGFARWDPELDAEGMDVKAVTWHGARLGREGAEWVAEVLFDI